jgi:hypothetical protein
MNTKQILTGIELASCRDELSRHVDLIEKALDRGQCNYDALEELTIARMIEGRLQEFRERTYH